MSTLRVCKRCWVCGRVQGVFYRASAVAEARRLGLDGYALNLPDGRVEVLACGAAAAVAAFTEWLWIGSTASKVTAVQVEAVENEPPPASGRGFVSR